MKPPQIGSTCNGCGSCCRAYLCGPAIALFGEGLPCKALESQEDGSYRCGLILHPSQYCDNGEWAQWKEDYLSKMFSYMLGIGHGCESGPEHKNIKGFLAASHDFAMKQTEEGWA